MREVSLDTETTGLDPFDGHRIVEIGCVELMHHVPTGNNLQLYINPEREMPQEAYEVHGLDDEFLSKQPIFTDVVGQFEDFIGNDPLVIHNAAFDMKFLNAEMEWAGKKALSNPVVDTLVIARKKYPGSPASLDALCKRFEVDRSHRTLHGALLDANLLARVYLELSGGQQPGLVFRDNVVSEDSEGLASVRRAQRPNPLPPLITEEEKAAHAAFIDDFPETALWRTLKAG